MTAKPPTGFLQYIILLIAGIILFLLIFLFVLVVNWIHYKWVVLSEMAALRKGDPEKASLFRRKRFAIPFENWPKAERLGFFVYSLGMDIPSARRILGLPKKIRTIDNLMRAGIKVSQRELAYNELFVNLVSVAENSNISFTE